MSQPPETSTEIAESPPEVIAAEVTPGLTIVDMSGGLPDDSGEEGAKPRGKHHKPESEDKGAPPSTGIPTAEEWQNFLGLTVLRVITEAYLHLVLFREIDESELTPGERDMIRLEKEDLREMAKPMASFAYKNKHARKHGRTIIAAADSYEALVDLFIWMRRVNKIARKHRKPQEASQEENSGTVSQQNGSQPGNTGIVIHNPGTG
jgi:hypothetical protein